MKIAIIPGTFFPQPGGAQVQIHNLANKLIENKIDVKCYVFEKSNLNNNKYQINHLNKIILNFVFIMKYYFNLKLYFILNLYLKSLIKKNQYDLWHFNFIKS
jgi:glycosyltransferase involved in cell wall biosynthesis